MPVHTQYRLNYTNKISVDLFAGGGGASIGTEMATGMPVDIAVNHNENAISQHKMNHPHTKHFTCDVFEVKPRDVVGAVGISHLHASPDCTHHSQAAGGQPRSKASRSLSWVICMWAGQKQPDLITMENVKQILNWGPLVAKRCKRTGRVVTLDKVSCPNTGKLIHRVADRGERVPVEKQFLIPDRKRRAKTWRAFVKHLNKLGYQVEHSLLRACDYGAATTRERLFLVARRDGEPICWPEPTHFKKPKRGQKKWDSAANHIDWSIPCRSIFERDRPLADATLRRIAKGTHKFILTNPEPFIVPIANWSHDTLHGTSHPLRTITANPKGGSFAVSTAYLAQMNGGFNTTPGHTPRNPLSAITTTGSQQQVIAAHLIQLRKNCDARAVDDPLSTLTASGGHHSLVEYTLSQEVVEEKALRVAAFLMSYYGTDNLSSPDEPLRTITTKDRLALVTVYLWGHPFVIIDICLRMLQPYELYGCQGMPSNYVIDRGHDGRKFSKATQVQMVGNSVSPYPQCALVKANMPLTEQLEASA